MPQHRAHLTWAEGPHMHLSVHADDEEGALDLDADPDLEQTLDVPSGRGRLEDAKEAATAVLLAAGWHLHGSWVDEPNETTAYVDRSPADYDETDIMAGVPLPESPAPVSSPRPSWRDRPYTGPKVTAEERAAYLRERGIG
ncbi:hypothetical protein [Streptomyces olivaceus]|uniref:hypothetical protein n=1 Tax=Streptomyces olivaceus TaxID=47716 RepID=UPI004055BC74